MCAVRCWGAGLLGPRGRRALSARAGAAPGQRATGRDGRAGDTRGAKPRGCASTCATASAWGLCSVGTRGQPKRNWARPCRRGKTPACSPRRPYGGVASGMGPRGSGNTSRRGAPRRVRGSMITTVRSSSPQWPTPNTVPPYKRRKGPRRP